MSRMETGNRGRLAALAIGTALASATLAGCAGKAAPSADYSAAKASEAIEKGKGSKAVDHAEAAVLANPRDAQTRMLLGSSYMEAGRFASAAAAFADAVTLGDTQPRTIISLALAQMASNQPHQALATLDQWEATLDPADFGLAVALAGRPQQGVHVLSNALRNGQNTAKVRQNLAYAFALQGNWRAARVMAAEDVPADKLGQRMGEWAQLSVPGQYQQRVATLLGVPLARDPGQPAMLALANHPSVDQLAEEVVSLDVPTPAPAETYEFAQSGELPPVDEQPVVEEKAVSVAEAFAEAEEEPSMAETVANGIRFVSRAVVQNLPSYVRPALAPAPKTAAEKPAPEPVTAFVKQDGNYRVQLGSYFSMSDAANAWKLFQKRHPELKDAKKVITKARVKGRIYYRVAAGGFARNSAKTLCSMVKRGGNGCIAYAASNPLPGTIDNNVRVAAR